VRAALAGIALVAALALTACGASVSLTPVAKAADATLKQQSEHVALTGSVTVAGKTLTMAGDGDFQSNPNLGAMTLTMSGGGLDTTMDEVIDGTTIYMRSPLFSKGLPAGKTWVSVDLEKQGKQLGIDFSQFAQTNPADALSALKKAGSVTKLGAETIDGESTTHYRARIDLSKVPQGTQLQKLANVRYAPVDVWIGDGNLLRRMTMRYSVDTAGQAIATTMTMSFTSYGEHVTAQAPPAGETVDMTKLGG
jgi:LppX_LprAFG lipoprotein